MSYIDDYLELDELLEWLPIIEWFNIKGKKLRYYDNFNSKDVKE
jgi:hypothetical protein